MSLQTIAADLGRFYVEIGFELAQLVGTDAAREMIGRISRRVDGRLKAAMLRAPAAGRA